MSWTVEIVTDSDIENPSEWDGWKLHSFSTRHSSFTHPHKLGLVDDAIPLGLRRKLAVGTAFFLSYYEHGLCQWSLQDEGPKCEWDSVRCAGILIWNQPVSNLGPKTFEDRKKDARNFVDLYTAWCNGNGYGFRIFDGRGREVESCYGFYGTDDGIQGMCAEIAPLLKGRRFKLIGEHADYFVGKVEAAVKATHKRKR